LRIKHERSSAAFFLDTYPVNFLCNFFCLLVISLPTDSLLNLYSWRNRFARFSYPVYKVIFGKLKRLPPIEKTRQFLILFPLVTEGMAKCLSFFECRFVVKKLVVLFGCHPYVVPWRVVQTDNPITVLFDFPDFKPHECRRASRLTFQS
jgi:hypothetical protein